MAHYELHDRISHDASIELFSARAIADRGFEKPVVIKRLLPTLTRDSRLAEHLIAEANLLALLRHRNIRQIFDVGTDENGHFFLVMEHVDGSDLARIWQELDRRRRRLPLDLVLWLGAQICDALSHAHSARDEAGQPLRLVHRNLMPKHVLVSRYGEVKIGDFATSTALEGPDIDNPFTGRYGYLSPEQARHAPVNAQADIFALGVILWEFITGRRLFSGMRDPDAIRAVRAGAVPSMRAIDKTLPNEVQQLISRATSSLPENRFSDASAMAQALRDARYHLPETAADPAAELALVVGTLLQDQPVDSSASATFAAAKPQVVHLSALSDTARTDLRQLRDELEEFAEQHSRLTRMSSNDLRELDAVAEFASPRPTHEAIDETTEVSSVISIQELQRPIAVSAPTTDTVRISVAHMQDISISDSLADPQTDAQVERAFSQLSGHGRVTATTAEVVAASDGATRNLATAKPEHFTADSKTRVGDSTSELLALIDFGPALAAITSKPTGTSSDSPGSASLATRTVSLRPSNHVIPRRPGSNHVPTETSPTPASFQELPHITTAARPPALVPRGHAGPAAAPVALAAEPRRLWRGVLAVVFFLVIVAASFFLFRSFL